MDEQCYLLICNRDRYTFPLSAVPIRYTVYFFSFPYVPEVSVSDIEHHTVKCISSNQINEMETKALYHDIIDICENFRNISGA